MKPAEPTLRERASLGSGATTTDKRSPVFIGGHHRSGTTLMRVMLHRHPSITCGPEGQLLDRTHFMEFHQYLIDTWGPALADLELDGSDVDHAMAAFMDNFFTRYAAQRNKKRWGEKTPRNIVHIEYLFRLFPQAKFIHMIRDPRDIHCSVMEKARTTTERWSGITAERTAHTWTVAVARGRTWRGATDKYVEVRYEDLTDQPVQTMRRILDFLGEPWTDEVLASPTEDAGRAAANVNRPVFRTSVGRWVHDLPPDDRRVIETVAGPAMRELGYEVSVEADWPGQVLPTPHRSQA